MVTKSYRRRVHRILSGRTRACAFALTILMVVLGGCGTRLPEALIENASQGSGSGHASGFSGSGSGSSTGLSATGLGSAGSIGAAGSSTSGGGGPAVQLGSAGTSTSTGDGGASTSPQNGTLSPGVSAANGSTVLLGNIGTYSGVVGAIAVNYQTALQVWAAYTNAHGGLNGHPVKIISEDDQGDPSVAESEAEQLIQQDHVLALIGNFLPLSFDTVNNYAASQHVPLVGGDSLSPGWFSSADAFPIDSPLPDAFDTALGNLVQQGDSRIGIGYCVEVADLCGYLNNALKSGPLGKYIVVDQSISLTQVSYTSFCVNLQNAKVQTVAFLADGASAERFISDCDQQGYKPKVVLLSLDATPSFVSSPVAVADSANIMIPSGVFPVAATGTPALTAFHQAYSKYDPSLPLDAFTAMAWTSGELMLAASSHLTATPSSQEVLAGLWGIKANTLGGLTGPLTFNTNAPVTPESCVFMVGISGGHFTAPNGATPTC